MNAKKENFGKNSISAFCIAGTNSGCGKTTIAVAIAAALRKRGMRISTFKCGPDYIDPSYLSAASSSPCINLDAWMMGEKGISESFLRNVSGTETALVEGVMGLFDGAGSEPMSGSTAQCAAILQLPIVLIVNVSGCAGSIAAIVHGFTSFVPELKIIGIIANKVGSPSHAKLLEDALRKAQLPPMLGSIPKNQSIIIPERHLGLLPFEENTIHDELFDFLAKVAEENIDIDKLLALSKIDVQPIKEEIKIKKNASSQLIAIARDEAFSFYYPDNFYYLKKMGFDFIYFSPLRDKCLPQDFDLLYFGGGFPEIFAERLAENCEIRKKIKDFAENGGKIYAECGGFMYLTKTLRNSQGKEYPMCGIINGKCVMRDRKAALGYRQVKTLDDLPFCSKGTVLRGHEFHWSEFETEENFPPLYVCSDVRGNSWMNGIVYKNVRASYIHLYLASLLG